MIEEKMYSKLKLAVRMMMVCVESSYFLGVRSNVRSQTDVGIKVKHATAQYYFGICDKF